MRHAGPATEEDDKRTGWYNLHAELGAALAWWDHYVYGGGVAIGLLPGGKLSVFECLEPHPYYLRTSSRKDVRVADFAAKPSAYVELGAAFSAEVVADLTPLVATYVDDPRARHDATLALAEHPSAASAARLVELLADPGAGDLDAGNVFVDHERPFSVSKAAADTLAAMRAVAVPVVLAALPAASPEHGRQMVRVFETLLPEERFELRDWIHKAMLAWAEKVAPEAVTHLRWERQHALRVRDGELEGDAIWHERLRGHPVAGERALAIERIVARILAGESTTTAEAFALELVALLEDPVFEIQWAAAGGMRALPCVLPADVVRTLAASVPRRGTVSYELLPALARYGEPASGLAAYCVDLLRERPAAAADALIALGPAAAPVRARLLELMVTSDEASPMSSRSMRAHLARALGDVDRVAAELVPRIRGILAGGDEPAATAACYAVPYLAPHAGELVGALAPYLDRAPPRALVIAAILAVASLGDAAEPALARLRELAEDRELAYWVGQALERLGRT